MKKQFYKIGISIILLFQINVLAQTNIFFEVDEKSMFATEKNYLNILKDEKSNKQLRVVKLINIDFDKQNEISLSLFDGVLHDFNIIKKIKLDTISLSIFGKKGKSGFISLIIRGDNLTGTIQIDNKQFSIIPLGNKIHAIIEIDYSKLKPEEPPIEINEKNNLHKSSSTGSIQSVSSIIDILVAYTPAADNAVADIEGLIENAIFSVNNSFPGDDIDLEYNLVLVTELVGYSEGSKTLDANF